MKKGQKIIIRSKKVYSKARRKRVQYGLYMNQSIKILLQHVPEQFLTRGHHSPSLSGVSSAWKNLYVHIVIADAIFRHRLGGYSTR